MPPGGPLRYSHRCGIHHAFDEPGRMGMQLIGMLDSPYVRRVAVSMAFWELPFTHVPVSVFRHFDEFARINPIVKAPSLVTDDGVVLMESSLILDYLQRLAPPDRRLMPPDIGE